MKHRFETLLDREIHFTEWGSRREGVASVICWHGLARTCRDFDILASHLHHDCGYHVVCPDTIGRGLSQWSPKPEEEYHVFFYIELAKALIDRLGIQDVLWFGTSMGGMIGYLGAATTLCSHIKKLILNDIGPHLCTIAIQRILSYAAVPPECKSFRELEAMLAKAYQSFGIQDPDLIRFLVEVGSRRTASGSWTTHYDPKVVDALRTGQYTGTPGFERSWELYDQVTCPTLTIRGSTSDLFSAETLQEMSQRGPRTATVIIEGIGHAPAMNTSEQIQHVVKFFGSS